MHERGHLPDLVSGASAGAGNGAIIAGSPPERRTEKLREFFAPGGAGQRGGRGRQALTLCRGVVG